MNSDYLRECIELSKTLSFTETAKRHYTSQPVLSRHVASVEKELGFPLFMRTKNGIHTTPVGQSFIETCEKLMEAYDSAVDSALAELSGSSKPINLGYLYGACSHFLPKALQAFAKVNPSVPVSYRSLEFDEVASALEGGLVDIAITSNIKEFDPSVFGMERLYEDSLCAIVPKSHPLAGREVIELADLVGQKVILPKPAHMPEESALMEKMLSPISREIDIKSVIIDLNSVSMSLLIENSIAIEFSHLRHIFSSDFIFAPLGIDMPSFDVVAVWRKSHETKAIRDLARQLAQSAQTR